MGLCRKQAYRCRRRWCRWASPWGPSPWPPTALRTRASSRCGSTPRWRHIEPSLRPLWSQIVHKPPCRKQNKCRFPHQPWWIRDCRHQSAEVEEDGEAREKCWGVGTLLPACTSMYAAKFFSAQ
jgi:hypothetical protein